MLTEQITNIASYKIAAKLLPVLGNPVWFSIIICPVTHNQHLMGGIFGITRTQSRLINPTAVELIIITPVNHSIIELLDGF